MKLLFTFIILVSPVIVASNLFDFHPPCRESRTGLIGSKEKMCLSFQKDNEQVSHPYCV